MLIAQDDIRKILFVNIAHIGDVVVSTPITRALKKAYPYAQVDALYSNIAEEAAYHNPYISKVFSYDIKNWLYERRKLQKLLQLLRQQRYDLAVTPCYGTLDPIMVWLCGAKYRVGFKNSKWTKFFTHVVCLQNIDIRHETENQLEVLTVLGIMGHDSSIVFRFTADEVASLREKFNRTYDKPLVLLCPFSRGQQKDWTIQNSVTLIKQLAKIACCCLIGSQADLPKLLQINVAADNIAEVLGGSLTLGELAALIDAADLLITVDTGPLHIAQAFQTPVLALFGPTDPRVWGPRGSHDVVLRKSLFCSPCWHKTDYFKNACLKNECMEQISAQEVLQAAEKMLEKYKRQNYL